MMAACAKGAGPPQVQADFSDIRPKRMGNPDPLFQGVGQSGARDVGLPGHEHLGLGGQAPQRSAVQDARPVAGERAAFGGGGSVWDQILRPEKSCIQGKGRGLLPHP